MKFGQRFIPTMTKTIHRNCDVCGTEIEINVDEDGEYDNGNYFGEHDGEEQWECDPCWNHE